MPTPTITAKTLERVWAHARNLSTLFQTMTKDGKRTSKPMNGCSFAVENDGSGNVDIAAYGPDGSRFTIPYQGMEDAPHAVLRALMGLPESAGTSLAAADGKVATLAAQVSALQAAAAKAETAHNSLLNERNAIKAALARAEDERQQLLATVEELTGALAKAAKGATAPKAEPIKARLDAAVADHGDLLSACVAETEAQAKGGGTATIAKPAAKVAPVPTTAPTINPAADLGELPKRADVELETVSGRVVRVTFLPMGGARGKQGHGVADALKAVGFKYDAKASENGRLVWVRS